MRGLKNILENTRRDRIRIRKLEKEFKVENDLERNKIRWCGIIERLLNQALKLRPDGKKTSGNIASLRGR